MRRYLARIAALVIGSMPLTAQAAPINIDQLYGFSFGGVGSPLSNSAAIILPTNPPGVLAPDAPWTFTLASAGTLRVQDLFNSTDQFEIFNFGTSLGLTSVPTEGGACGSNFSCAVADSRYSSGVFALTAGSYSITGLQVLGVAGAGAFIVSAVVPGPIAGAGLPALLALGGFVWARRRKAAAVV